MGVNGKSFLIDTTRCIACRGCQVACKQWNMLSAEPVVPTNRGTYENPPDLSATQWVLVHFKETERADGSIAWNFVRSSCRHCIDAPCRQKAVDKQAIVVDEETGAVLFTDKTKNEDFEAIRRACPYNIPRKGADGALYKCRMCVDRVQAGMLPACAKTCPTGAITFGDRTEILDAAQARVAEVRGRFPHATVIDSKEARLVLLLADPESAYKLKVAS